MWECKDRKSKMKDNWTKKCKVEKCPMEAWVEGCIIGAEWDLWVEMGCTDCPLDGMLQSMFDIVVK